MTGLYWLNFGSQGQPSAARHTVLCNQTGRWSASGPLLETSINFQDNI